MHIIPFKGRNESMYFDLNLLYNDDKIYIMDNHLAASWCWAQKIDMSKKYNLLHIDRHYDLFGTASDCWVDALKKRKVDMKTISAQELFSLKSGTENMPDFETPIFRWDNYITNFYKLYPNILDKMVFAVHEDEDGENGVDIEEVSAFDLHDDLSNWLNEKKNHKWIVNLDIDYFFTDYREEIYFQLYADEYILSVADQLKKSMQNIEVLTIALSPEMCGGWDKSERVAKLITGHLGMEWMKFQ